MDQIQQFISRLRAHVFLLIVVQNSVVLATWYICATYFSLPSSTSLALSAGMALITAIPIAVIVTSVSVRPLKTVWQAIMFVSPDSTYNEAPVTHNLHYAHELVTNLINHVYKIGHITSALSQSLPESGTATLDHNFIASSLPLPLVVLDKDETVLFANKAFCDYVQRSPNDIMGKSVYTSIGFSFTNNETLGKWLDSAKEHAVTTSQTWEHVRLNIQGDDTKTQLVDMAGFYNKNNPEGYETMLVLFDHTDFYGRNDQAINFVALAVHELRTPLTSLRGYIEALEEDLSGKLNPELDGYMRKLKASAQQLTNFVNNVLNVARIEEDQMMLKLEEADWGTTLEQILQELTLRASVRGISIDAHIQPGLPTVGVDKVSITEVMNNLIDNAIKYSSDQKKIIVSTGIAKDGTVETTIQDFGTGIPTTAMQHLFEKFYRDYHNKQDVGGTGIGLYLCKKLVGAHGGNIWVQSKEGEGSTFAFTLIPYAQLAEELKNKDNDGIVRSAHGWIKNHSMYRR